MLDDKKKKTKKNTHENNATSNMNQYENLRDKWNEIQEDYLETYSELDMDDIYFEGGGFQGLLEKISDVRGKSIEEIRSEIQQWPTTK